MLPPCFIIVISGDTLYHDVKVTMCALCVSERAYFVSLMFCVLDNNNRNLSVC
jgi:hypothetical protein